MTICSSKRPSNGLNPLSTYNKWKSLPINVYEKEIRYSYSKICFRPPDKNILFLMKKIITNNGKIINAPNAYEFEIVWGQEPNMMHYGKVVFQKNKK